MSRARPDDWIVVTGATSGLGADAVGGLARAGYRVAAGFRRPAAVEALTGPGVTPLRMDVTDPASLEAAAATLRDRGGRVAGLVVNAGMAVAGPIEIVSLRDLQTLLEVNVVGAVATVQAFLPALRAGRGRIVLMSSVSGRRSAPVVGPYAASKYALEAVGDALRMETGRDGVEVVILEPGGVRTPIWNGTRDGAAAAIDDRPVEVVDRYRDMLAAGERVIEHVDRHGMEPAEITELLLRVFAARRVRTRYPIGKRVGLQTRVLARILPDRWFDWIRLRAMGIR